MRFNSNKFISRSAKIFVFLISLISIKPNFINAEDSILNEIEINNSTKSDTSGSALPTNPFEIVEMIRRANSLNDATNPSEAIDDALKLFNSIEEEKL